VGQLPHSTERIPVRFLFNNSIFPPVFQSLRVPAFAWGRRLAALGLALMQVKNGKGLLMKNKPTYRRHVSSIKRSNPHNSLKN